MKIIKYIVQKNVNGNVLVLIRFLISTDNRSNISSNMEFFLIRVDMLSSGKEQLIKININVFTALGKSLFKTQFKKYAKPKLALYGREPQTIREKLVIRLKDIKEKQSFTCLSAN